MTLRLIDAPESEPVTVAEVKRDARIDHTDLDTDIGTLITAARQTAEDRTGRALMPQTWELVLDDFPGSEGEIVIGKLPIDSITSVKYYDAAGVLQTLDSDQYTLDADTLPGRILPAYSVVWPSVYDIKNAVIIRFVAGYADADSVPAEIKMWIRLQVAREVGGDQVKITPFADALLDAYRLKW